MNKSESITNLVKSLTSFQGKMTAVKKDAVNPFYKSQYATLDTIWEAIRKLLSENELSVAQTMNISDGKSVLETTLYHTSGEWISGTQLVNPVKDDPQSLGSAISYARRYSLSAMLGIVADEDDDAEVATKPAQTHQDAQKTAVKPKQESDAKPATKKPVSPEMEPNWQITPAQTKKIYATAKEKQFSKEEAVAYMQEQFNKSSTKELTKAEASTMIEFLNKIKPGEGHLVRAAKAMGVTEVTNE